MMRNRAVPQYFGVSVGSSLLAATSVLEARVSAAWALGALG